MRKWLIGIGVVVVALGAVAWVYRDFIGFMVMARMVTPSEDFAEAKVPSAPNYADPSAWAALPDQKDYADIVVTGQTDEQANAPVDVFFVHPTTYLKPDNWNQPLADKETNDRTDQYVLQGQASVYNGSGKIYAPRYRQATFASFMDDKGNGEKAIDLAYKDVEAAFDYFLSHYNNGRPFILAGHSQGSRHIFTLLERRISGTPLLAQMIAAYPIGFGVNKTEFTAAAHDIPVCDSATQTGCVVTWNSVDPKAPIWRDPKDNICVNPITWKTGSGVGGFDANLGSLSLTGGAHVVEKAADADCVDGRLLVSALHTDQYDQRPMILGKYNYHILDYALFYMNLRKNAQDRTNAFLAKETDQALATTPGSPAPN